MSPEEQISLFDSFAPEPPLTPAQPTFDPNQIPFHASVPIPPGTYGSLEQLAADCHQCQRCVLGSTRTHAVISRGNPQAPLMIVGEGPGQNEDETGFPFVGKAGQLLDKILESVDLDREQDVYICNVVKCRPPGNRAPTPEEMDACRPYLWEQIRLVNPKVILLAGATAVRGVLGRKDAISKIRGQWMEWEGRWCMPIFHPAYLLRNQSREKGSPKWLMWEDIQTVQRRLVELAE